VSLANKLIDSDPESSGRRMRAHRPGGTTRVLSFASPDQEAAAVAAEVTAAIAAGTLASDIAVLVRSGYRADAIMQALRTAAVPVSDWRNATHEPQDRRALAACLSVVRGTLNPRQLQRLTALMGVPDATEQRTDVFLASVPKHPLAAGLREVRRLAFEGASAHAVASAAQAAVAAHNPALGASMIDIVNAVAHFEAHDKQFSLEHLLSELALGSIGRSPTIGGGVKLASLHRTKGLQWKQVYLVGLEEGHHPHYKAVKDPQRLSEERRLCFVGVSRAEDSLTVTWAASWKTWKKDRSRFILEMGL
jgi:superfamily I DNA/RNA helicase